METSQQITRKSASNLALAFVLLPREKRDAMAGLYAFCREVDDVADEDTVAVPERQKSLNLWRKDIQNACLNGTAELPVNRELVPIIRRFNLPLNLFEELIKGVEMDLSISRYPTIEALEHYCYRVASVVGLLSIEIFGYSNPSAKLYADHLGKALQLTNILRDVRVDAERGRIYLPQDWMGQNGVLEEDILNFRYTDNYRNLALQMAGRVHEHYLKAREILTREDRRSMIAAELMGTVYWRLFKKLEARNFNVFGPELTRLSKPQKIFLIFKTWFRFVSGNGTPSYGSA